VGTILAAPEFLIGVRTKSSDRSEREFFTSFSIDVISLDGIRGHDSDPLCYTIALAVVLWIFYGYNASVPRPPVYRGPWSVHSLFG